MAEKKSHKRLWMLLFVLLNIAVVAFIAVREFGGGYGERSRFQLGPNGPAYLAGGVLCVAAALGAETSKYLLMMRKLGEKASFRVAFETGALGKYYDYITPSGAGGQPFQIFWMLRHGYSVGAGSAMPVASFLTRQIGFVLLAVGTFVIYLPEELSAIRYAAYVGAGFYAIVPLLLLVFSASPRTAGAVVRGVLRLGEWLRIVKQPQALCDRIMAKLMEYRDSFGVIAGRRRLLAGLLLLSVGHHIVMCSIPYFVLRALGCEAAYGAALATTIYIYASVTIIPTPGNSGAAEGSFYLVFSALGASGVFWAMLIWRALCYYSFLLIGVLVLGARALTARKKKD